MRDSTSIPQPLPDTPLTPVPTGTGAERTSMPWHRRGAKILLAVDGSELAGQAARIALALVDGLGGAVHVVHAMDTRGVAMPPTLDIAIGMADALVGPQVHETQAAGVRAGVSAALGKEVDWPVRIGLGSPAAVIASEAERMDADLIILGLRRHGPVGRALQDETTLAVMRRAGRPILAVTASLAGLPRRALVGVDFSRTSREAAHLALRLLAPGGRLLLAHAPAGPPWEADEGEGYVHALGVDAAFAALVHELAPTGDRQVERVMVEAAPRRSPADHLLGLIERVEPDLLVLGSRRYGRVQRWMLGSVTTDVARDGRISMLVVPPSEPRPTGTPEEEGASRPPA